MGKVLLIMVIFILLDIENGRIPYTEGDKEGNSLFEVGQDN